MGKQPCSCTTVVFPHLFPIKPAILAGRAKRFCFLSPFELIASGSKAAGFCSQSQADKVVLPTNLVKGGREHTQARGLSLPKTKAAFQK